ncbi:MAG: hypothetical protein IKD76_03005 [Clostridia bacterium]|nr:hypothetical protein [Clostridia bacterium]
MYITQTYKNAFTEVHTILDYIEEEDYNKIISLEITGQHQNKMSSF